MSHLSVPLTLRAAMAKLHNSIASSLLLSLIPLLVVVILFRVDEDMNDDDEAVEEVLVLEMAGKTLVPADGTTADGLAALFTSANGGSGITSGAAVGAAGMS